VVNTFNNLRNLHLLCTDQGHDCLSVLDMSRTIARTLRAVFSPLAGARRCYGYDSTCVAGPSTSRWGDEARNPVVRDSLVPIVVEQSVCCSAVVIVNVKADS
jgi:hypothetical protein